MKRLIFILSLIGVLLGWPVSIAKATITVSNNAVIILSGNSLLSSDGGEGYRFGAFLYGALAGMHPTRTNYLFVWAESGATQDKILTNNLPQSIGAVGMFSNNYQHLILSQDNDNGALSSNDMYLSQSNIALFPVIASAGSYPLTSSSGWMASHPFQFYGLGGPPTHVSDGGAATQGQRSGATYHAGLDFGIGGVDTWLDRVLIWTNDIVNSNAVDINFTPTDHIEDGGDWDWMINLWRRAFPNDTNVANSMVDFATGTVVRTNNTVVDTISKTGNSITFVRHDLALAPPYFVPHADGSITNDTRRAFYLDRTNATFFNFGAGVTNLPAGNWDCYVDNVWIANYTSAQLATGVNWFTNNLGPYWAARESLLFTILDWFYVDHKTLIPGSAGDQVGLVTVGSNANAQWSSPNNKRGDDLIAAMNSVMTKVQTNFTSIYTLAQPTAHTIKFVQSQQMNVGQLNVYALLVPGEGVGKWRLKYGPGYDPNAYNWFAVVSPDLVHWTMWGSHTLDDTDDLVYRAPKGGTMFAYAVGFPKVAAPTLQP